MLFIAIAALFIGISLSRISAVSRASTLASQLRGAMPAAESSSQFAERVRFFEERLARNPDDIDILNSLSTFYLQRLRETGSFSDLDLARRASRRSLHVVPPIHNVQGVMSRASSEFASHEFAAARDDAQLLTHLEGNGTPYALLGDAEAELGNYQAAERAYAHLRRVAGESDENVATRTARMALLRGANDAAKSSFSRALAIELARVSPSRELVAWYAWQLGDIGFFTGDYAGARVQYENALSVYPGYFRALASRGRLDAAEHQPARAIADYAAAIEKLPDPTFVAELGDVYAVAGDHAAAQREYDFVDAIGHLSVVNGVMYNRQLVMFDADHDRHALQAFRLAQREYETRRDILGADAVAWTAFKAGKITEAARAMHAALRMGTRDPRLLFHAGLIAQSQGKIRVARSYLTDALHLSPEFDPLQASVARRTLHRLGGPLT